MPRKAAIDHHIIKEVLKSYPGIFTSDGELKFASDPVWREVCTHTSFQKKTSECEETTSVHYMVKPKQIHDYVFQDRHDLQTFLRQELCISSSLLKADETDECLSSDSSSTNEETVDSSYMESQRNQPTQSWQIFLPYEQYLQIKPSTVMYKEGNCKKRRKVLRRTKWTSIVSDALYKQHGIPCALSFKRNKVRISDDQTTRFISAVGHCIACSASVYVTAEQEPDPGNPLILHVRAPDTREITHSKKTQLRGEKRSEIGKEMLKTLPSNWRREKLDNEITFGEKEPPNVPSLRTCQVIRQEAMDRQFGTPKLKDPVLTLAEMKHSQMYIADIHTIAYDRFFVHYWSKEQTYIYKQYCAQHNFPKIEVDATGSLVLKLKRENGLSAHIFLYEIVIHTDNMQICVSQMLSESQDIPTISFWLGKWLKDVQKMPAECVCDFSFALLGALSRALNDCSLVSYLKTCMSILLGLSTDKPVCYIRVDVAHLIKTVCRWKCYPKQAKLVRKFFIRCVGLMIKCASLDMLKHLLLSTLILAGSETTGNTTSGETSQCEKSKLYLCHCIETGDLGNIDANFEDPDDVETNIEEEQTHSPTQLNEWVFSIVHESEEISREKGDEPNPYFCPTFLPKLIHLMKYFPIWTAVMQPVFKSPNTTASSASVEGEFGKLKNAILQHNPKPMRVDKFVACHLKVLKGSTKIAAAAQIPPTKNSKIKQEDFGMRTYVPEQSFTKEVKAISEKEPDVNLQSQHLQVIPQALKGSFHEKSTSEAENIEENMMELQEEECWRGKNKSLPQTELNVVQCNTPSLNLKDSLKRPFKKRQTYLKPYPEICQTMENLHPKKRVGVIRNGSCLNPIRIGSEIYRVTNTCPFDALLQSMACLYVDYEPYRDFIDNSSNAFLNLVQYFVKCGPTMHIYRKRAKMLLESAQCVKLPGGIIVVNAEDYIGNTIQTFLNDIPSLIETFQCQNVACKNNCERYGIFWPINTNNLKSVFQFALNSSAKVMTRTCSSDCKLLTTVLSKPGPHLILEPRVGLPSTQQCLTDFPDKVTVSDIVYALGAVIMHVQGSHYVTYCRRKNNAWEIYNDLELSVKTIDASKVSALAEVVIYVKL